MKNSIQQPQFNALCAVWARAKILLYEVSTSLVVERLKADLSALRSFSSVRSALARCRKQSFCLAAGEAALLLGTFTVLGELVPELVARDTYGRNSHCCDFAAGEAVSHTEKAVQVAGAVHGRDHPVMESYWQAVAEAKQAVRPLFPADIECLEETVTISLSTIGQ